eukprot:6908178-Prymnesium_polylepis.1
MTRHATLTRSGTCASRRLATAVAGAGSGRTPARTTGPPRTPGRRQPTQVARRHRQNVPPEAPSFRSWRWPRPS